MSGQSHALVTEFANVLQHREVLSWILLGSMMFFSSLAFSGLKNAMAVIFEHRIVHRPRHLLVWYFSTISQATVVYGSLATAILAMLGLEFATLLVLFGAQVISEYEKLGAQAGRPPQLISS